MKAIQVTQTGSIDVLSYQDVPENEPNVGEIRVLNQAIGLNYIDVYHRTGFYPLPLPFIPGREAAGIVDKVGAGVTNFKEGDRVVYLSSNVGTYAEKTNISLDYAVALPDFIDFDLAASIFLKGLTSYMLLHQVFQVQSNHTIFNHAAAGGVGSLLGQWAKAKGAVTIGSVGNQQKADYAKQNGYDYILDAKEKDFVQKVQNYTNGQGVDVVYDGIGQSTLDTSLSLLKKYGLFVSFGQAGAAIEHFDLATLAPKCLFATRPTVFHYMSPRVNLEKAAKALFDALQQKIIKVEQIHHFPLKDVQHAHQQLEQRQTTGSIIFVP